MAENDRPRPPHHPGDPEPPKLDPDQPDPSWGDEGGGGEYEGPITHGAPEPPAEEAKEDERPRP